MTGDGQGRRARRGGEFPDGLAAWFGCSIGKQLLLSAGWLLGKRCSRTRSDCVVSRRWHAAGLWLVLREGRSGCVDVELLALCN